MEVFSVPRICFSDCCTIQIYMQIVLICPCRSRLLGVDPFQGCFLLLLQSFNTNWAIRLITFFYLNSPVGLTEVAYKNPSIPDTVHPAPSLQRATGLWYTSDPHRGNTSNEFICIVFVFVYWCQYNWSKIKIWRGISTNGMWTVGSQEGEEKRK